MSWYVENNGAAINVRAKNIRDRDTALVLVAAIQANIPLLAQADRSPEGEDREDGLHRNDESAVAASDAPKE